MQLSLLRKKPNLPKKARLFGDADLARKSRAFGIFAMKKAQLIGSEAKKARLFGKQIWLVKVGLLETLQ